MMAGKSKQTLDGAPISFAALRNAPVLGQTQGLMSRIHVIGGGLAGLSAAVTLSKAGRAVSLYEATAAGGGRCRSYFDPELQIRIDNGNHLLLSGNTSAAAYIDAIGARDRFTGPKRPLFPFIDLKTGREWTIRPNKGRIPWWLLFEKRRVPKTTAGEHLILRELGQEWDDTTVAETMPHSSLYWLFVEPLSVAALNTRPHEGLACLLGAVLRETMMKGGRACIPRLPKEGLSEALIDPAFETLRSRGADIQFNRRITGLAIQDDRVVGLESNGGPIAVAPDDAVVLAVPPWIAGELLPTLTVPDAFESILNVHFKIEVEPVEDLAEARFTGIINGLAEWLFIRSDHVSVTVSAANKVIDRPAGDLAAAIWKNVVKALGIGHAVGPEPPPYRVIKERRATFAASAAQEERRPEARTDLANLVLAGDWTDTRLPATIEGAIRSGVTAANLILKPPAAPAGTNQRKKIAADVVVR